MALSRLGEVPESVRPFAMTFVFVVDLFRQSTFGMLSS